MGVDNNAFRSNTDLSGGWLWKYLNKNDSLDAPSGGVYFDGSWTGPVRDNGGQEYNVTNPLFGDGGAKGDGSEAVTAFDAAIEAATAGSTIRIPRGTYKLSTGLAQITKSLHFHADPGAVLDVQLPIDSNEKLFDVQADNVSFSGLTFDLTSAPAGTLTTRHICIKAGAAATPVENIRVANCRFLNLTRKGAHDTASSGDESTKSEFGIYASNVTGLWVEGCEMTEVSGSGVFVDVAEFVRIIGNRISMLSTSDCLYPIHLDSDVDRAWIVFNEVTGGDRASGGAIDVMSQTGSPNPDPCKRIFVNYNVIHDCPGFGSASNVIRFNSVESGTIIGNLIYDIDASSDTSEENYISVNARTGTVDQPGPKGIEISGNVLVCGGSLQRAIDVRNDNSEGTAGDGTSVDVHNNQCLTDGTNYFGAGIRVRDIEFAKVRDNTITLKRSASVTQPNGVTITTSQVAILLPEVSGNDIDCNSIASSDGIVVDGAADKDITAPIIDGNTVRNAVSACVEIGTDVVDPHVTNNRFYNAPASPIVNGGEGTLTQYGNRYEMDAARHGTWTISSGQASVTVTTAEVRTGDRIFLTLTTDTGNEVAVKVSAITTGTSFVVKTLDAGNVAGDISGTWSIEH